MRTVETWKGATDNAAIPNRVKVRLIMRAEGVCASCGIKILATKDFEFDHIKALINGGTHSEDNLQVVHSWCHKEKTAADVAEKSRTYRKRKANLGIKKRSSFACSRGSKWKRKISGEVVLR